MADEGVKQETVVSGSELSEIKSALLDLRNASDRYVTEQKFFNSLIAVIAVVVALVTLFTALIFFMFQWQLNNHVQVVATAVKAELSKDFEAVNSTSSAIEDRLAVQLSEVRADVTVLRGDIEELIGDSSIDIPTPNGSNNDETNNQGLDGALTVSDVISDPSLDIVQLVEKYSEFSTLVSAASAAGLLETLSGEGPFTVFAPTNEAFADLPSGTVEDLLRPENRDQLIAILTYHIVPGEVSAEDLLTASNLKTIQGATLDVAVEGGLMINGARILVSDVKAANGLVQVIDHVILPPM